MGQSMYYVAQARDALNEGHRFIAHELNDILGAHDVSHLIASDSLGPGDSLRHAAEKFRAALTGLRTKVDLPADDYNVEPWTLGFINGPNNPPQGISVAKGMMSSEFPLSLEFDFLRRQDFSGDQWREWIISPVSEHHAQWLDLLDSLTPKAKRYRAPACPECKGKCNVMHTRKEYRIIRCKNCGIETNIQRNG